MYLKGLLLLILGGIALISCDDDKNAATPTPTPKKNYTSWIVGDTADVKVTGVLSGTVLAGGGLEPDEPMRWMLQRAKGGDVVVIRIGSGGDGYNEYFFRELGVVVNSVETILLNSREVAQDADVVRKVRNAECLFFTGGDQSLYYRYIDGTPLETAINYLKNEKKITVGGNSAGCAIQGEYFFSAENLGSNTNLRSEDALRNPYDDRVTVRKDFLRSPFLDGLITDTHYDNPNRRGRHIVFMARMAKDYNVSMPKGIGIDERTVVCIDEKGIGRVFGRGYAYFISPSQANLKPEICEPGKPLTWNLEGRALRAYEVGGSTQGTGFFDVATWSEGQGGAWRWYSSENGTLKAVKD